MRTPQLPCIALFFLLFTVSQAKALTPSTFCIWDPVGTQGPVYSFFYDLKLKALSWGVDLNMLAYESELEALRLLEQGHCDTSLVTAILARDYVRFGGSLDAIGAIRSQEQLGLLLKTLSATKLRPALKERNFEISAVLPVGPMYAFVSDRKIYDLRQFRDKTISALNGDVQTKKLARVTGASSMDTTISNFAELFKRDVLNIVLMPAIAYTAFELDKAMRNKGGVIDIRFFNGMLQAISDTRTVSSEFSDNMRRYMSERTEDIFKLIRDAEEAIPDHYWIRSDGNLQEELETLFKDIRLELMVKNHLDRRALNLLWRIRCKIEKAHTECSG